MIAALIDAWSCLAVRLHARENRAEAGGKADPFHVAPKRMISFISLWQSRGHCLRVNVAFIDIARVGVAPSAGSRPRTIGFARRSRRELHIRCVRRGWRMPIRS